MEFDRSSLPIKNDFYRYLDSLKINPQDLIGKRFVDCECEKGTFIYQCLHQRITNFAYGIDNYKHNEWKDPKHFKQGNFTEKLPWDQLDYIFFVRSLFYNEFNEKEFLKMLDNLLAQLRPTGEIRISPLDRLNLNTSSQEIYPKVLKVLKSKHHKFKLIPIYTTISAGIALRTEYLLFIKPKDNRG